MTRQPPHTHDDPPPEARAFADDIRAAIADVNAPLSIEEIPAEPGYEPSIVINLRGLPLFTFRRDEFLEAVYLAGCEAMEELQREGQPLSTGRPRPWLVQ